MSSTLRTIVIIAVAIVLGLLLFRLLSGCAHMGKGESPTTEQQLYTALDVIADTVDPASALSKSACDKREELEISLVKAGSSTTAKAEKNLQVIRERCNMLREIFDRIRTTHSQALAAIERGAFTDAQHRLEHLRELWRSVLLVGGV